MTDNLKQRIAEALRPLATRSSPNASQYVIEQATQAALAIIEPMIPKWVPIDSAPKSGEIIYTDFGFPSFICWNKERNEWSMVEFDPSGSGDHNLIPCPKPPTHFMPLPTPPEKEYRYDKPTRPAKEAIRGGAG